jgi:hypothetical protein
MISSIQEFTFFSNFNSLINTPINFSLESIPQCRLKSSLAFFCILESRVAFTILHIFLIQASSICLTLSLVIGGRKDAHILCSVSLSQDIHILFFITSCSFSEREHNMSSNDLTILLLFKIAVSIFVYFFR